MLLTINGVHITENKEVGPYNWVDLYWTLPGGKMLAAGGIGEASARQTLEAKLQALLLTPSNHKE